ncbi:MAG: DUF1302 domain-containing protein [Stagnimonas sp.]|nr:DUF1302 domain-containing protein [Stagnimonas sp.]
MSKKGSATLRFGVGCSLLAVPLGAMAFPFQYEEFKGSFDTTVSAGMTLRTQSADKSLIGIANDGTARSVNEDDGNLGFDQGDLVSGVLKATHDLEIKWRDYGVFSRVNYFYDAVADGASHREDRFNAAGLAETARKQHDYELGKRGRDRLVSEIDTLDLFVYGNFDLAGHKLSARFGKQVVSWGESTFIGNSINSINPIDVAKIRAPGAELKEALIPTALLWSSLQLSNSLSLEGVWLTAYEKTLIDPRGSFFSSSDIASDDGDRAVVSFGRREDDNEPTRIPAGANAASASVWVPRQAGPGVDDATKQFGVALRYFAEQLASTEFGLYYLRYHSRTPLISAIRGGATASGGNATNATNTANPLCSSQTTPTANCRTSYFVEFPGSIDLYGLSFNTTIPWGIALQGEYSYRPNQPTQLSGTEILLTALGVPSSLSPAPLPAGTYIKGYRSVDMHQLQVTGTKAFGPTLGAEQFVLVGEAGVTHMELPDALRFNGPGAGLPACGFATAATLAAVSNGSCQENVGGGFATDNSWGYRLVSRMDFENAIGPAQLSPRLVFAHDVNGVGPSFNHGTKAVTLGLGINYLQRWQGDIGYTAFFGGRTYAGTDPVPPGVDINPDPNATTLSPGDTSQSASFATSANPNKDRDFLAVSVSYAF